MNRFNIQCALVTAVLFIAVGCSSSDPVEDEPPAEPAPMPDELEEEEPVHEEAEEETEVEGVLHMVAMADVMSGEEEPMGQVMFTQTEEGVEVHGRLENLEPGPKGFHVHEHGECDPPDFESAGGHFNPTGHPHGGPDDPAGERHAGDFGNIEFDEDGVAEFTFVDDVISLGEGTNDIVGQALIVHYEEDDQQTQPTGDAGPRAGCGIIETDVQPEQ